MDHPEDGHDLPASGFLPSGFFVWRTPLLPVEEFLAWSGDLQAPTATEERRGAALRADQDALRSRLKALLQRAEIREALYLASPSLLESLPSWTDDPDGRRAQKVETALVRYVQRMATRPTPFGLFAGCSLGIIGETTCLAAEPKARYRRHTRLDMDYLFALAEALGKDPAVRKLLTYRPNPTLYRIGEDLRYMEARLSGKTRSHHLVAVEETDYLAATLARAKEGVRADVLAAALSGGEVSREEADEYIQKLIDGQILISDLSPAVTGPEPIHDLIAQLGAHDATKDFSRRLEAARTALDDMDRGGLGRPEAEYQAVARALRELPTPVDESRLFQVDLAKPAEKAELGPAILKEIERGLGILHRLSERPRETLLQRFRERFSERYGELEVPLLEALDDEIGVGLGLDGLGKENVPLLQELAFPSAEDRDGIRWPTKYLMLQAKMLEAAREGSNEIVLSDAEVGAMSAGALQPLPDALAVLATVAGSEINVREGRFKVLLDGVIGPSGARLLGRFCHGDAELEARVSRHLVAEEALRPDAIHAELVHLPAGRAGNVLLRPLLRDYEIPLLGRSGAPRERQIPLSDLRLRVAGDRIVLRSERLGREVLPRLTSAQNTFLGVTLYTFLASLQEQHSASGLSWSWGPMETMPYLPRVSSGKLVLSRAAWQVAGGELKPIVDAEGAARFRAVQEWRAKRKLPRWVVLADADNELPVDLDNVLSIEAFLDVVKRRPVFRLLEFFPGPEETPARGPEGRFLNELIVPFVRAREALPAEPTLPPPARSSVALRFAPGSECHYVKLYTGNGLCDRVLEALRPTLQELEVSGAASCWFFIRYGDPGWHLRLRFFGDRERLREIVQPRVDAAVATFLSRGSIWRAQRDTYDREADRYGGPAGIELSEELFHQDSVAVLEMLNVATGDEGLDARWRLALRGMALLLDDLGFDLRTKRQLVTQLRSGFARDLGWAPSLDGPLGKKFRKERAALEALIDPDANGGPLAVGLEALRRRSQRLTPLIAELRARARQGRLTRSLEELAESYLHMHANRLLRSAHRAQEFVLYDFLQRLYESSAARGARMPRLAEAAR